jgi:hypothetical protein
MKTGISGLAIIAAISLLPFACFGRDQHEQHRIDYLIDSLSSLKGAVFIRNGTEYDAPKARGHLLQKLNYAGERVKTAEQFIQYCATESSMSHKAYQIRFADGHVEKTSDYFTNKLRAYDAQSH